MQNTFMSNVFLLQLTILPWIQQCIRVLWTLQFFMFSGPSSSLAERLLVVNSWHWCQQKVFWRPFLKISTCLHVLGFFRMLGVSCGFSFRFCRRCARSFRNRQPIHWSGNGCDSLKDACCADRAFDTACWWSRDGYCFRCAWFGAQPQDIWTGSLVTVLQFQRCSFLILFLLESKFPWLSLLEQLSADPACSARRAQGISWRRLAMRFEMKTRVCWIPVWEFGIIIFWFQVLFHTEFSFWFLCFKNLMMYWTNNSMDFLSLATMLLEKPILLTKKTIRTLGGRMSFLLSKRHTKWRKLGHPTILRALLWPGR